MTTDKLTRSKRKSHKKPIIAGLLGVCAVLAVGVFAAVGMSNPSDELPERASFAGVTRGDDELFDVAEEKMPYGEKQLWNTSLDMMTLTNSLDTELAASDEFSYKSFMEPVDIARNVITYNISGQNGSYEMDPDNFISSVSCELPIYNLSDSSPYYVAIPDLNRDNPEFGRYDIVVTYNNNSGEVIDGVHEKDGVVYIPKEAIDEPYNKYPLFEGGTLATQVNYYYVNGKPDIDKDGGYTKAFPLTVLRNGQAPETSYVRVQNMFESYVSIPGFEGLTNTDVAVFVNGTMLPIRVSSYEIDESGYLILHTPGAAIGSIVAAVVDGSDEVTIAEPSSKPVSATMVSGATNALTKLFNVGKAYAAISPHSHPGSVSQASMDYFKDENGKPLYLQVNMSKMFVGWRGMVSAENSGYFGASYGNYVYEKISHSYTGSDFDNAIELGGRGSGASNYNEFLDWVEYGNSRSQFFKNPHPGWKNSGSQLYHGWAKGSESMENYPATSTHNPDYCHLEARWALSSYTMGASMIYDIYPSDTLYELNVNRKFKDAWTDTGDNGPYTAYEWMMRFANDLKKTNGKLGWPGENGFYAGMPANTIGNGIGGFTSFGFKLPDKFEGVTNLVSRGYDHYGEECTDIKMSLASLINDDGTRKPYYLALACAHTQHEDGTGTQINNNVSYPDVGSAPVYASCIGMDNQGADQYVVLCFSIPLIGGNTGQSGSGIYKFKVETIPLYLDKLTQSTSESSDLASFVDSNPNYSRKNAKYVLYDDKSVADGLLTRLDSELGVPEDEVLSEAICYFDTDANGHSVAWDPETRTKLEGSRVCKGVYYLVEYEASKGYERLKKVTKVDISDPDLKEYTIKTDEPPLGGLVRALKLDVSTKKPLAGAEFEVKWYNGNYTMETLPNRADATWTLKSGSNGYALFDTNHLINGRMPNLNGHKWIPFGTITVTEVTAPNDYTDLHDDEKTKIKQFRNYLAYYPDNEAYRFKFENVLPPPVPEKTVDKTWAEVDEEVNYTVLQRSYVGFYYDTLEFDDDMPDGLTYKENSFRVEDGHGQNVTYDAGTFSILSGDGGNHLHYTFNSNWLYKNWEVTDKLTFYFTGIVKDSAAPSIQKNKAKTITNESLTQWTNEVETEIPEWWVDVTKQSSNTDANALKDGLHNVYGAVYDITDANEQTYGQLVTDEHGYDKKRMVHSGRYVIDETLPPMGHRATHQARSFTLSKSNAVRVGHPERTISESFTYKNTWIPFDPPKTVDKTYAEVGEVLTYEVTQEVSTIQLESMEFKDVIPEHTTYKADSFQVIDPTGNDITVAGGTLSTGNRTLDYNFKKKWLQENHGYDVNAAKFKFRFQVIIDESGAGKDIPNTASVFVNEHELVTNTVHTKVPYWLVEVVKTSTGALDDLHKAEGAVFELYDDSETIYATMKTSGDPAKAQAKVLHAGTYKIREVTPPAGHRINMKIEPIELNTSNDLFDDSPTNAVSRSVTYKDDSIPYKPTKEVNKGKAEADEVLTYTIKQEISTVGLSSAVFEDDLPEGTTYVDDSFRVYDGAGNNITHFAGKLTQPNGVLTYTFTPEYLAVPNGYEGEPIVFTFKVKVDEEAAGTKLINEATIILNNHRFKTNPVETIVPVWYVKVVKKTDYPDILVNNPLYSLAGAVFEVRGLDDTVYGRLTSDAQGNTEILKMLHAGTYRVWETVPPLGHKPADPPYQEFTLNERNEGQTLMFDFTNESIVAYLDYIAVKVDRDYYFGSIMGEDSTHLHDTNWWQGNEVNFANMRVRVNFYGANNYTGTPLASAVFAADAHGRVAFQDATPVEGSWRYQKDGKNVMPLGYVEIIETQAPDGYNVDDTPHRLRLVQRDYDYEIVPISNCRFIDPDYWKE